MRGEGGQADAFRDLFDNAPCGYAVLRGTDIIVANATLAGWLGHDTDSMQRMGLHDILTLAARVLYETNLAPLLKLQGRVEEVSLELRAQNGVRIPVLLAASVQGDGSTRMAFHKAAARRQYERDLITARKGAEQNLVVEQREGELRELFVAVLGHDLRNPLASIAAATRLLAREPLGKNAADVLTLMQGSTHRMAQMIDNVLDFARGRLGGGIGLARRPDQLEPLIRQVVEELLSSVPHAVIQTEISAPHPVSLDAGRIGQMMSNLVGNALTHGDLSQPVRIDATVILPVLTGFGRRLHAAIFSFCAGVMPPMPMLGRSLL